MNSLINLTFLSIESQANNRICFWNTEGPKAESKCVLPTKKLIESIGINSKILEIGCGTGRVLNSVIDYGHKGPLYGIDWSLSSLNITKNHLEKTNMSLGDCCNLPYKNDSFDCCILSALLTCFIEDDDLLCILEEAKRVTKSSGIVFISDFLLSVKVKNIIRYTNGFIKYRCFGAFFANQPFRHFRLPQLNQLISSAGLQTIETKIMNTKSWHGHTERGVYIVCRKQIS